MLNQLTLEIATSFPINNNSKTKDIRETSHNKSFKKFRIQLINQNIQHIMTNRKYHQYSVFNRKYQLIHRQIIVHNYLRTNLIIRLISKFLWRMLILIIPHNISRQPSKISIKMQLLTLPIITYKIKKPIKINITITISLLQANYHKDLN